MEGVLSILPQIGDLSKISKPHNCKPEVEIDIVQKAFSSACKGLIMHRMSTDTGSARTRKSATPPKTLNPHFLEKKFDDLVFNLSIPSHQYPLSKKTLK